MNHRIAGAALLVPLALAGGLLAGCTAFGTPESGSDDAAASKFVACLTAAGQTAKIIDGGQVAVLMPELLGEDGTVTAPPADVQPDDGGMAATVGIFVDDEGAWMAGNSADAYPEEGGARAAWAGCEADVPEFEQPEPDFSGADVEMVTREDMIEASLAFAACARGEGYADFADPDENGMLDFPLGMTEDEFRSLLEACMTDGMMPPISQESMESFDFDWMSVMEDFGGGGMVSFGTVPAEPVG